MAVHPDESFILRLHYILDSKGKPADYNLDSKGMTQSPKTPMSNGGLSIVSETKWPTLKEVLDPQGAFIAVWYKIFVTSCLISVATDTLFFYIPYINDDRKCIDRDRRVRAAALVLRSLTDLTFVIHIIHEIRVSTNTVVSEISKRGKPGWIWKKADLLGFAKAIYQKMSWLTISITVDFIAILPIPQVALLVIFLKMDGSDYQRKILNGFLLFQYLPMIYRIYLSCKELKRTGIWARGAFNMFLYILAGHVLGAVWYFLSIQRETSCWTKACEQHPNITGCRSTYYCGARPNSPMNPEYDPYIKLLNESCPPVNPSNHSNATEFNFGMFLSALESGSTHTRNFPMKFFHSFWWGLRNLRSAYRYIYWYITVYSVMSFALFGANYVNFCSTFGQNLEASTYEWENCFAIVICLIGLLLFLYLIGNVQTHMQLATTKSEEIRQKMIMKEFEIQWWMSRNHLPSDMKTVIIENVRQKLEENKDVHVENLLSILPRKDRRTITHLLCMDALKKVPMLRDMDEKVLKLICYNLKPVTYTENTYVIRAGEPLDLMLFSTEGIIWTYTTSTDGAIKLGSSITKCLGKGDFFGEELLIWAASYMNFSEIPISTQNVKCHTNVEAFSLRAKDLKAVVSKFWWHFSKVVPNLNRHNPQMEELALSSIRACRSKRSKNHIKTPPSQKLGYLRLYPANLQ